jgi:dynein heavy chain
VKSIIICAGNLKREYIDEDESELVLKAIIDINVPKFTNKDVPLFMDILSDLFPNVKNRLIFDDNLMEAINNYC